jgi:predicted ATPase/DNA-binding winged helix-turn-helix (wHTH) protein
MIEFAPFRLDVTDERLWCGQEVRPLTPKAFAVLRCLVAHAGQLVTKAMLMDTVWPETAISESTLTGCIWEVRQALGDSVRHPHYLETVHGRGYRFIGQVTDPAAPVAPPPATVELTRGTTVPALPVTCLVGRGAELAQLVQWYEAGQQGQRQVGLIGGEPGIGKSALVETFVAQVAAKAPVWIAHGQCIEQYGTGEPYLPLLEALGRLCRGPDGDEIVAVVRQVAPSWLAHLPAVGSAADREVLARLANGVTPVRMMRELAEALEVVTATRPVILVLEDLHWSDAPTLEWLHYVARRRDPARLLVLGTYRSVEVIIRKHPLQRVRAELRQLPQGQELVLDYLTEADVVAYLTQRFGALPPLARLARTLHQRTNGNPLFLLAVVAELVSQQILHKTHETWGVSGGYEAVAETIPESLQILVEQHMEQLSLDDQRLLEAASITGVEFTAAAVAAALAQIDEIVEARCATLARQGRFLLAIGRAEWPDGTVTAGYRFRHALYQDIVYRRLPAGRQRRWHARIGTRLACGFGERAGAMATAVAWHCIQGGLLSQAVPYLRQAAQNAFQRHAYQEATGHLTRGLELLGTLPETTMRLQQELELQLALGSALIAIKHVAAPEVGQAYARARELCRQVGETPQLFPTLWGLWRFYLNRGELPAARELGEQLSWLAQHAAVPIPRLEAQTALGVTLFFLGEYGAAQTHLEQGLALTDPLERRTRVLSYSVTPEVMCLAYAALTLWCRGYPAQAVQQGQEVLLLAQAQAHPLSLVFAQYFVTMLHYQCRDVSGVQAHAEALLTLATAHGFPSYVRHGTCWRGWALVVQEQGEASLAQTRQDMTTILATENALSQPLYLIMYAEMAGYAGQVEEGLRLLAAALANLETSGAGDLLAEGYRLQGELLLRQVTLDMAQAEACFQQALAVARRQQAKSWELRAAVSLVRLWQQQGKRDDAYNLLAPIYSWFTEGFDTSDLKDAKALLDELVG